MTLTTLMYVSTSRLDLATSQKVVDLIVARARICNAAANITGALLFTGDHFVQILEGDAEAIDMLIVKLQADVRHEAFTVINRGPLAERRFGAWDMAYSGAAHFVKKRVTLLLNEADRAGQRRAARWLADMMHQFTQI